MKGWQYAILLMIIVAILSIAFVWIVNPHCPEGQHFMPVGRAMLCVHND